MADGPYDHDGNRAYVSRTTRDDQLKAGAYIVQTFPDEWRELLPMLGITRQSLGLEPPAAAPEPPPICPLCKKVAWISVRGGTQCARVECRAKRREADRVREPATVRVYRDRIQVGTCVRCGGPIWSSGQGRCRKATCRDVGKQVPNEG